VSYDSTGTMDRHLFRLFAGLRRQASAPRKWAAVTVMLFACMSNGSVALAAGTRNDAAPALPLAMDEFEAFVQQMAAEAGGSDAVMASRLELMGFTCIQKNRAEPLQCVRFGCGKGRLFWRSVLLQWNVSETPSTSEGAGFSGSAVSYSWIKGCYPEKDRVKAQERYWMRSE